jgi:hypothetical protein
MRQLSVALAVVALGVSLVGAQQEENLPTQLTVITAADVKVRYLDFKWDEEAFAALEEGGGAPAATRSWALARILTPRPLEVDGKPVTGGSLLILNPASGDTPMTLEIRVVDMRDVIKAGNVIAEPPPGKTVYKAPVDFETVDEVADRLTLDLKEADGTFTLSIHYGNRLATLVATRE